MGLFGRTSGCSASYNHSYISYGRPWTLILSLGDLLLQWIRSFFSNEPLQLSLPNESFYLLLQVVAISCVMTMITVEMAVLVSRSLLRISVQLTKRGQGSFVLDLHQDLVDRGKIGRAHV